MAPVKKTVTLINNGCCKEKRPVRSKMAAVKKKATLIQTVEEKLVGPKWPPCWSGVVQVLMQVQVQVLTRVQVQVQVSVVVHQRPQIRKTSQF